MSMYMKEYDYANSRLAGTYCFKGKTPVMVENVSMNGDVVCRKIGNPEQIVCTLDDLQVKGIKLGYINSRNGAMFLARMPKRRDWRQGLRPSNVVVLDHGAAIKVSPQLMERLMSDYVKNFRSAFEILPKSLLMEGRRALAWSRDWCAGKYGLYYRGSENPVATFYAKRSTIKMDEQFTHLKESLQRSINDDRIKIIV